MVDLLLSAKERRRIGDRIRAARVVRELTQQAVADSGGWPRSTYRNWEYQGSVPDAADRARLADLLGYPERALFAEWYARRDAVTRLLEVSAS